MILRAGGSATKHDFQNYIIFPSSVPCHATHVHVPVRTSMGRSL